MPPPRSGRIPLPRLPILEWGRGYGRRDFGADLLASVIVTIMLIPQSLAYAMLAGLPAEAGLYASMGPVLAYAVFGSSRVLAVGPVAVISLMTASALAQVSDHHGVSHAQAAALLAVLSGAVLAGLALLRMGWIANFLSHSVISGFISGSAVLIAVGQIPQLMGIPAGAENAAGGTLVQRLPALFEGAGGLHGFTLALGVGALVFLVLARRSLAGLLRGLGVPARIATVAQRAAPALAVVAGTLVVALAEGAARGVAVVGEVPAGLPALGLPPLQAGLVRDLLPSAVLLSLVGFVESISVGQSLAMHQRRRVDPDQELLGLGAANLVAGMSSGFPVTGGFSRSVVNRDAGAVTPMAGVLTGGAMALVALLLTPLFHDLPRAVLAAVIIVAVLPLVDPGALVRALRTSRLDGSVLAATFTGVLVLGVEAGIGLGVGLALAGHLWRSSRPHMAVVGRIPGTEHFRNVDRHQVETCEQVLSVRVDESLYFANARYLEDRVLELVTARSEVTDLVLQCSAVNTVDASAIETLGSINERLEAAGVRFHLSEVKGPVMDVLRRTELPARLSGRIFLTQHQAMQALAGAS